jgi:hypothetical protein
MSGSTKRFGFIVGVVCVAIVAAADAVSAQQQKSPQQPGQYTAMVVMTPNGPATCATWIQWRLPGAHPTDKAAIEYWAEGYLCPARCMCWARGAVSWSARPLSVVAYARDRLMKVAQHVMQIAERAVDRMRLRDRQVEREQHTHRRRLRM